MDATNISQCIRGPSYVHCHVWSQQMDAKRVWDEMCITHHSMEKAYHCPYGGKALARFKGQWKVLQIIYQKVLLL